MKLNKILLMAALAVGFASCEKHPQPAPEVPAEIGNTYVSLRLINNAPSTKLNDAQSDWQGRGAESAVSAIRMYSTLGVSTGINWTLNSTVTALADASDGEFIKSSNKLTTYPAKANPGGQTIALIANNPNRNGWSYPTSNASIKNSVMTYKTTFIDYKEDIVALAKDNEFVMTSDTVWADVVAEKALSEVLSSAAAESYATANNKTNVFKVDIERVVCQGRVALKDGLDGGNTEDGMGKIQGVTYSAINGAAYTYLYKHNAGQRTINANGTYDDLTNSREYKSAIHDELKSQPARGTETPDAVYETPSTVHGKLIRLGNISNVSNTALGMYAAKSVLTEAQAKPVENLPTTEIIPGIYFMENSVDRSSNWENIKDFGFYRLAQAKVYATFIPAKVYGRVEVAASTDPVSGDPIPAHYVLVEILQANFETVPQTDKDNGKYGIGQSFYLGAEDNIVYTSREAAKMSVSAPNQNAYKYRDGRCGWRALWNRQTAGDKTVTCADTRRNNTYLLTIKSFKTLGFSYDPSDPEDPNLPKPEPEDDDPDKPKPDPDIEPQDTYMSVIAEILQWNLVERHIEL